MRFNWPMKLGPDYTPDLETLFRWSVSSRKSLLPSQIPVTRSAKPIQGCVQCEKVKRGGGFVRERRLGVGLCNRDERGGRSLCKWVLENGLRKIFRKPFSIFYLRIFRSKDKWFPLTFILQRNKRPKMMKIFYGKHFTSKQTEPNCKLCI